MTFITDSVAAVWLIILIAMIVIEIATLGLTTIWFAGGALVAFVLSLLGLLLPVQIAAFLIVSVVLLYFTRPIAVKYFNKNVTQTNSDALVGQQAIVVSDINNIEGLGRVLIEGKEWSAKAFPDDEKIAAGEVVRVKAIEGVKLRVELIRETD